MATVINSLLSPRELSRIRIDTTARHASRSTMSTATRDADWSFHPAPGAKKAAEPRRRPRRPDRDRLARRGATETVVDDPWTASAGDDVPSNHAAQINRLVDDLLAGRPHQTTLASTRPTMEFVTALYASSVAGTAVDRADLTPEHPFYRALNGGLPEAEIAESFAL